MEPNNVRFYARELASRAKTQQPMAAYLVVCMERISSGALLKAPSILTSNTGRKL
jgi:hypothetical protein